VHRRPGSRRRLCGGAGPCGAENVLALYRDQRSDDDGLTNHRKPRQACAAGGPQSLWHDGLPRGMDGGCGCIGPRRLPVRGHRDGAQRDRQPGHRRPGAQCPGQRHSAHRPARPGRLSPDRARHGPGRPGRDGAAGEHRGAGQVGRGCGQVPTAGPTRLRRLSFRSEVRAHRHADRAPQRGNPRAGAGRDAPGAGQPGGHTPGAGDRRPGGRRPS
jgi:hypothetical protein